jgi:hypothetical protein
VQLHRAHEEFERSGVRLVLIGQATPRQATHFRNKLGLEPLPVLADEERRTYRIAGLNRGSVTQLVGPRSLASGVRHGIRSGVMQGKIIGDAAQLGGEMIVLPDGSVPWSHVQENAGDTVPADDLLEAARAAM